jgi:predicted outer membrane repeat protein
VRPEIGLYLLLRPAVNANIAGLTVKNCKRYSTPGVVNSGSGGGLRLTSGSLSLNDVTFTDNYAQENGGGIYLNSLSATFTKLVVEDNEAEVSGGGIYLNQGSLTLTQNSAVESNSRLVRMVDSDCAHALPRESAAAETMSTAPQHPSSSSTLVITTSCSRCCSQSSIIFEDTKVVCAKDCDIKVRRNDSFLAS